MATSKQLQSDSPHLVVESESESSDQSPLKPQVVTLVQLLLFCVISIILAALVEGLFILAAFAVQY